MSKPTIYIAAGHGGSDPGAVSGKYIEKALTLKTALACQNYLRNYECETVMARTTDKSCTVAYKMEEVEKKRPSLVLEIHYNAGGGEGCEVYYWHTHAPSKSLAQKVLAEMVKLGQKSRGIKESKAHKLQLRHVPPGGHNGYPLHPRRICVCRQRKGSGEDQLRCEAQGSR